MCLGDYRGPKKAKVIIKYILARNRREQETLAYRTYVTDSLRLSAENKYINERWVDMIRPKKQEDVNALSIVLDVMKRAGLVMEE